MPESPDMGPSSSTPSENPSPMAATKAMDLHLDSASELPESPGVAIETDRRASPLNSAPVDGLSAAAPTAPGPFRKAQERANWLHGLPALVDVGQLAGDAPAWLVSAIIHILLMIVLALLLVFGPLYWSKAAEWVPALHHVTSWFDLLRYPVSIGLMFIGLTLAHMFLPVERHPLREIMPGIVATIVLWLMSAWVYAYYLGHFSRVHVVYAGIANAIIALIFLYITAVLWILGGEINQALIVRRQRSGVLALRPVAED